MITVKQASFQCGHPSLRFRKFEALKIWLKLVSFSNGTRSVRGSATTVTEYSHTRGHTVNWLALAEKEEIDSSSRYQLHIALTGFRMPVFVVLPLSSHLIVSDRFKSSSMFCRNANSNLQETDIIGNSRSCEVLISCEFSAKIVTFRSRQVPPRYLSNCLLCRNSKWVLPEIPLKTCNFHTPR